MTFIKSCKASADSITSLGATFGSAVAAGNALVVAFTVGADLTTTATIADNATGGSNTYTKATSQYDSTNNQCLVVWYALNLKSSEALTVTVSWSGSHDFGRIIVSEYSGGAASSAADGTSTNIANGTTAADNVTSGGGSPPTTTQAGDLLAGSVVDDAGGATIAAGTNFTERDSVSSPEDTEVEDRTLTGTGTVVATWTLGTAHRYMGACLALKASAAATYVPCDTPHSPQHQSVLAQ